MSRIRDIKRKARRDRHKELSVAAYYFPVAGAASRPCTVRTWLRVDEMTTGTDPDGGASMANSEERVRFHLPEFAAPLRRGALVSIAAGEGYRIDHLYPVDDEFQTARVVRLSPADMQSLPVPV
ncbi:hypothetical protein I5E68_09955 [Novosphingobium sp. YJ-S2-02]|uniref:Head-tail adaptor protein n=1 Tax=Novosphingobium aureum TaxID=2792964 RepID=A0A931HCH6_9SPHN|nr:hypothetical protein [Novosphingobium aureum]MBH0113269.1 hypothetical protein [Novosphingobium aureum]